MEKEFVLTEGDLKVPCKLLAPEAQQVKRLVLGVHGIGGSMEDEIQRSIAEEMEMFYAAVLRFDFPSHGVNPQDGTYMTLPHCRQTLLTAARWLRDAYPQVEDLCIFATGFGAYITLTVLEELQKLPGKIKLVVQTPSVLMHESMLAMRGMSEPTLEALGSIPFRAPRPFDLTYSFYCQLREHVVLKDHSVPMLILHGEADDYIPLESIQNFRRVNEQSKLVIIPGASHRFLEEGAWDMVLDLTRDWFEFEQVLCCDWE